MLPHVLGNLIHTRFCVIVGILNLTLSERHKIWIEVHLIAKPMNCLMESLVNIKIC